MKISRLASVAVLIAGVPATAHAQSVSVERVDPGESNAIGYYVTNDYTNGDVAMLTTSYGFQTFTSTIGSSSFQTVVVPNVIPFYPFSYSLSACWSDGSTCWNTQTWNDQVVSTSAFSQFPGLGTDIGVYGDARYNLWVVGADANVYHWTAFLSEGGSLWTKVEASATRIDVDSTGTPWVVNSGSQIFRFDGREFQQVPGGATDIGCGGNGSVWVIGNTFDSNGDAGIFRWNGDFVGDVWTQVSGRATRIDVDSQGNPWVVNSGGAIFHWNGSEFVQVPGLARDVATGSSGSVAVLGQGQVPGGSPVFVYDGALFQPLGYGAGTSISMDMYGNTDVVNLSHNVFAQTSGYAGD